MKRRVEFVESDGHRRIYEETDVDEWRRRKVEYVFKCVQNNIGICPAVLVGIGRMQYGLEDIFPTINVEQGIPVLQRVTTDEHITLILGERLSKAR